MSYTNYCGLLHDYSVAFDKRYKRLVKANLCVGKQKKLSLLFSCCFCCMPVAGSFREVGASSYQLPQTSRRQAGEVLKGKNMWIFSWFSYPEEPGFAFFGLVSPM